MICSKCNHKLPDDSEFCQYCGAKIEPAKDEVDSSITSEDALSAILRIQAEATIDAMNANAAGQPDNEEDEAFGLVPEKPIFTLALKSVDGEKEYLNKLRTLDGEKIKYTRRGSCSVEGINGMIDIYDTFLPSGQLYKTIYINMYGAMASITSPQGFVFAEKRSMVIASPTGEHQKTTTAKKYCSHCGSLINEETKTCTGCGKQYFKGIKHFWDRIFCKKHLALVIVSFVLLVSLITNIVLAVNVADLDRAYHINRDKVESYEDLIDNYQNTIDDYQNTIDNCQNTIDDYQNTINGLENNLYFYDKYVVFVSDDGTNLYHKVDCYKFDSSYFWAYNINAAKDKGYRACSWCCD